MCVFNCEYFSGPLIAPIFFRGFFLSFFFLLHVVLRGINSAETGLNVIRFLLSLDLQRTENVGLVRKTVVCRNFSGR